VLTAAPALKRAGKGTLMHAGNSTSEENAVVPHRL